MARRKPADDPAHIVLNIETKNPIELNDFVSAFTSVANQYEKFVRANYSELSGHADMFVREVRAGSIEVDLIPWAMQGLSAIVNVIEQIQIVDKFVRTYGASLSTYIGGSKAPEATRSDLKDFMGAVSAIANVRTDAPPYRWSHSRMERRKSRPRSRSIHWRQGELRHKSKISDLCLRHRYMRTMSGY